MPWIQTEPEMERRKFVQAALRREESMRVLCQRFGISRKTGYKHAMPRAACQAWPMARGRRRCTPTGVRVPAGDRRRLEHLARYAGRPAIAASRLMLLPDGRVAYALKKQWKDGTTAVVMAPEVLIERLLALVPRPRRHLVTYHGVLGPAAGLRSRVVPGWVEGGGADEAERSAPPATDDEEGERTSTAILAQRRGRRRSIPHAPQVRGRRYPWAELLRRVFEVEVLVCPHCGGRRRLLAAVTAPESIERVLRAMGLPCEAPELAAARAPPGGDAEWGA